MADEAVEQIREEHAAATRGPWGWVGNLPGKTIDLMALRGWGEIVMDFRRWGFQGAQPAFVVDGLIRRVSGDERHPSMLQIPQAHHPWEVRGIDHPDARFLAHSWEHVATLLAKLDAAEARLALLEPAAGAVVHTYEALQDLGEDALRLFEDIRSLRAALGDE